MRVAIPFVALAAMMAALAIPPGSAPAAAPASLEAQDPPPRERAPGDRFGGGLQDPQRRMPFGPGMMGQGSMVAMGRYLYVLVGVTIYKVDPESMEVVKTLEVVKREDLRPRPQREEEESQRRRPPENP